MNSSTKKCPFCHNQISIYSGKCPKCNMILIERFQSNYTNPVSTQSNFDEKKPKEKTEFKSNYRTDFFDSKRNLLIFTISCSSVLLLILFVIINYPYLPNANNYDTNKVISDNHNSSNEVTPGNNNLGRKEIQEKYYANGNIFQKDESFFTGYGQLEIKNGTSDDAVIKLVNWSIKKSVMTVYVRRNSDLNINGINDGDYSLFFDLGRGYDEKQNIFMKYNSPSKFDEALNFNSYSYNTSDGVSTNYSTFKATLNPVIGGTASTSNVTLKEFMNY